jgi:iron-sulfur cluster assembly accessory protein
LDEVIEQDGIKLFVDSKAIIHLIGTEMDFISDDLSEKFTFDNPNVKETCGCGQSFSV